MKFYILGGLSCLAGLFLILYQALSSMMTAEEIVIKRLTLMDVINAKYIQWVDNISIDSVYNIFNYILNMPLFYILLGLGILLLIIGGFVEK